ncbi:MAG: protein-glutamate O-methyltransferase CheR [Planctomycetota bacterium]
MSLPESDVDFLRGLVAEQTGNVISPRQAYLLEQRLTPVAETAGVRDVQQLVQRLRSRRDSQLSGEVAEAVTVNETSFFRDRHVFECLGSTLLPEIIARNQHSKKIKIWSAACSSGQEPYSIAIVIREMFPHLTDWSIRIFATDISNEMLNKTRRGVFSEMEVNRGLPAELLTRYFTRFGPDYRVRDHLQSMVEVTRINLTKPWTRLEVFDIVFMRNVLIYFDQRVKSDILSRTHRTIANDGYMFIGSAETTIGLGVPFMREEINGTVCYRPTAH